MTNVFGNICQMMGEHRHSWLRRNPEQAALYMRDALNDLMDLWAAANPAAASGIEVMRDAMTDMAFVEPSQINDHELFRTSLSLMLNAACVGVSMGYPMAAGWDEQHKAQLGLVDLQLAGLRRDHDGDIVPPGAWRPADLAALLARTGRSVDDHAGSRHPLRGGYQLPEGATGARVYDANHKLIDEVSREEMEKQTPAADPFNFWMGNDAADRPYTVVVAPYMTPEQVEVFKAEWVRVTANQNRPLRYVSPDAPHVLMEG